jgi:hypothetical protein
LCYQFIQDIETSLKYKNIYDSLYPHSTPLNSDGTINSFESYVRFFDDLSRFASPLFDKDIEVYRDQCESLILG